MPQTHKENQEGLNEAYYSHCSFRRPTQPLPAEINPRGVLKRLFGRAEPARPGTASTGPLDRQHAGPGPRRRAKTCAGGCPRTDQHKLDEYLDSVRSVERRIAAIEHRQKEAALAKAGVRPSASATSRTPRPSRSRFPKATSAASTCR